MRLKMRMAIVFFAFGICRAYEYRVRGTPFGRTTLAKRQRHGRRLQMYGKTAEPTEAPSEEPSEDDEPSWFEVPPTALPSVAPTTTPSASPSISLSPSSKTPTKSPSLTTSPTSTATMNPVVVPLADFRIEYLANDKQQDSVQQVMQEYLFDTMKAQYDTLTSVQLTPISPARRNRHLQEWSWTSSFSGNAIFEETSSVPAEQEVQSSQTTALEDSQLLQASFDSANINLVVQQVVVQDDSAPPPPPDNNTLNVGLIAGVSVAAAILVALAMLVGYRGCKERRSSSSAKRNAFDLYSDISTPTRKSGDVDRIVTLTPDDIEPTKTRSMPTEEDEEDSLNDNKDDGGDESVEVSSLMDDEFSLSAASADSSIKQNPEKRRESLLKKLALYQRTTKAKEPQPQENVPMPAAFFVPHVVESDRKDMSDMSMTSFELTPDSPATSAQQPSYAISSRGVSSLLDQSRSRDDDEVEEYSEQDLLPPPLPVSTAGTSSQWALDTTTGGHQDQLVRSPDGKSQWALSLSSTPPRAPDDEAELRIVPKAHDFPSTTWAHPPPVLSTRSYSDGPSDEMNHLAEQDLTNFQLAVVSPDQSSLDDTPVARRVLSPPSPPQQQQELQLVPSQSRETPNVYSSRARPSERRSSSTSSPLSRGYSSEQTTTTNKPPLSSPTRKRSSSTRSRRGLDQREVTPSRDVSRSHRPRSSSQRRRARDDDSGASSYEGSYDGSFASNGTEVIEDLNTLSDFLREKRQAKQAQRRARSQQRSGTRG